MSAAGWAAKFLLSHRGSHCRLTSRSTADHITRERCVKRNSRDSLNDPNTPTGHVISPTTVYNVTGILQIISSKNTCFAHARVRMAPTTLSLLALVSLVPVTCKYFCVYFYSYLRMPSFINCDVLLLSVAVLFGEPRIFGGETFFFFGGGVLSRHYWRGFGIIAPIM